MATKATAAAENVEEPVFGTGFVNIKIPKTKDNQGDEFVSINERTWQIKRGVTVRVPDYVAQMLEMREDQIEKNINALPDNR